MDVCKNETDKFNSIARFQLLRNKPQLKLRNLLVKFC